MPREQTVLILLLSLPCAPVAEAVAAVEVAVEVVVAVLPPIIQAPTVSKHLCKRFSNLCYFCFCFFLPQLFFTLN